MNHVGQHTVATVGTFDGMLLGHQYLAKMLLDKAGERGGRAMVFTFASHPRREPLLMPVSDKVACIQKMGIEVSVLEFTQELKALSAADFMLMLNRDYGVDMLLMGFNNNFGHSRPDSFGGYVELGRNTGIEVVAAPEYVMPECGVAVSSSYVRNLLSGCRPVEAADMLGRFYSLKGVVVHGKELGRTIGYPTANVEPFCSSQLVPGRGVYASRIKLHTENGTACVYPAMLNIGHRPTVDAAGAPETIEVHILGGFSQQIYGCAVEVEFLKYLRPERRFDSLDGLKRQLSADAHAVAMLCGGVYGQCARQYRCSEN